MTYQQLSCLCEVVTCGSFSIAAERLFLSQSAISKNIIALEKEIGFPLLIRDGRTSYLTTEGKQLMPELLNLLDAHQRIQTLLQEMEVTTSQLATAPIQLHSVPILTDLMGLERITEFMNAHPQHRVDLSITGEDSVLSSLRMGNCDLAFCSNVKFDHSLYHFQSYSSHKNYIYVGHSHPLAQYTQINISALKNARMIFPAKESLLLSFGVEICKQAGFTPIVDFTTNTPVLALEHIKKHHCVYWGFDQLSPNLDSTAIHRIELLDSPPFSFGFVWKKSAPFPPPAKEFLAYMALNPYSATP